MPPRLLSRFSSLLPLLLLLTVTYTHVFLSPYTKVEESFTLHATHDFLTYGLLAPSSLRQWDHTTFPGAVPRSFLPSVLLGLGAYPVCAVGVAIGWIKTKIDVQIAVRLTLAAGFSLALNHLLSTLRTRFGPSVRTFYLLLAVTQFHIMYYAGRTLPNFMALPAVIYSLSLVLRASSPQLPPPAAARMVSRALTVLTATATVVRLELALSVLPTALLFVLRGKIPFFSALRAGLLGGFGALAVSAPLDLYLWSPAIDGLAPSSFSTALTPVWWTETPRADFPFSRLTFLWPELTSLYFNIVLGHAEEWGVSPWHTYQTAFLPKITLCALPLDLIGHVWALAEWLGVLKVDTRGIGAGVAEVWTTVAPGCMAVLAGMSAVGHKEWRFIIYVFVPILFSASFCLDALWHIRPPLVRRLVRLVIPGVFLVQLGFTVLSTYVSILNYPGGEVWRELERLSPVLSSTQFGQQGKDDIERGAAQGAWRAGAQVVHFSSYPLQNGASLFTFVHSSDSALPRKTNPARAPWPPAFPAETASPADSWTYSKTEALVLHPSTLAGVSGHSHDPDNRDTGLARRITHLVLSMEEAIPFAMEAECWAKVASIPGYDGLDLPFRSAAHPWGRIRTAEKVVILQRKDEAQCRPSRPYR